MINLIEKWGEIEDDNIDDEIKQYFTKYNVFLACLLEKNEMVIICDNYYTDNYWPYGILITFTAKLT